MVLRVKNLQKYEARSISSGSIPSVQLACEASPGRSTRAPGARRDAALITGVRESRWPLSSPGLEFPMSKLSQLPARGTFLLSSSTPVLSARGSRGCPSEAGGACPSSTILEVSALNPRQLQRGQLLGCPEEWQLLPQTVQVANGDISSTWSQKSSSLQMSSWLQKVTLRLPWERIPVR